MAWEQAIKHSAMYLTGAIHHWKAVISPWHGSEPSAWGRTWTARICVKESKRLFGKRLSMVINPLPTKVTLESSVFLLLTAMAFSNYHSSFCSTNHISCLEYYWLIGWRQHSLTTQLPLNLRYGSDSAPWKVNKHLMKEKSPKCTVKLTEWHCSSSRAAAENPHPRAGVAECV